MATAQASMLDHQANLRHSRPHRALLPSSAAAAQLKAVYLRSASPLALARLFNSLATRSQASKLLDSCNGASFQSRGTLKPAFLIESSAVVAP